MRPLIYFVIATLTMIAPAFAQDNSTYTDQNGKSTYQGAINQGADEANQGYDTPTPQQPGESGDNYNDRINSYNATKDANEQNDQGQSNGQNDQAPSNEQNNQGQ